MSTRNPTYLGDGVYAEHDGFGIWLRANHHEHSQASDKIYLEPEVLAALIRFNEYMTKGEEE